MDPILLDEVIYDKRARDGTWCTLPYPSHPKGCPNYPKCPEEHTDFLEYKNRKWYAIIEEFDLAKHAIELLMKPWCKTHRQARCVLYWQRGVNSRLKKKAEAFAYKMNGTIILERPEANGVNVFATMAKHGLLLKANPDYVYKIMLVGVQV